MTEDMRQSEILDEKILACTAGDVTLSGAM